MDIPAEEKNRKVRHALRWQDLSLTTKVLIEVLLMTLIMFTVNLVMFLQVNRMAAAVGQVYESNVGMEELSESLDEVQNSTYSYLLVKSSDSLERYYKSEETFRQLLDQLNDRVLENPAMLLEQNIRSTSETYLEETADAVTYKRGRNVEKYRESFAAAQKLYGYLNSYIYELNNQRFSVNSESFLILQRRIRSLAVISMVLLIIMMGVSILMLYFMVRGVVSPSSNLAVTAKYVGEGNFHIKMPQNDSLDEVGVMTRAFNTMVSSLEEYMNLTRQNMEKERQMKEKELRMETHLKEAQLKYLQSQINPHFLFNSLNAGAQLAMLEDAEQTSIFVEKMADFFRYNVKKGSEDATLEEEIEAVENYIYILNVRFAGEIRFSKEIDETALEVRIPSMILQPIVENAVNHGIRNIDWEGQITLSVTREPEYILICIKDNGKGISADKIAFIMEGKGRTGPATEEQSTEGDSTGIGLSNVISRLELYFDRKDLLTITSPGENMGTEVQIRIPDRQ